MNLSYKIGVDGGGTKTELILVDDRGEIVARHHAPGCNPNIAGPERARETLLDALHALAANSPLCIGATRPASTLLCMAGAPDFWRETATTLTASREFGPVTALDDSIPVLEFATDGRPGLVLHGGTGSFVAARDPSGKTHYAGGLGWRFGDEGSGHEIGRLAIARALLELQGWAPGTSLAQLIRKHTGLPTDSDSRAITRWFYQHPEPNRQIAALAPAVLDLAEHGDEHAQHIIRDACLPLLALAERVAAKLFPARELSHLPAGLSGPILTHPVVQSLFRARTILPLTPITTPPIEGVRRLLQHLPP
ncbi:ATPase [Nibricoccus aquaticus]|uniref:ATPase n=1 Tax=Nibricoccus aquaticus TaxID=2576891 RepID=A0A290Q9Q7_9BACT|nr:BadF/BadG/BcrA/BcrD ATPase family protein [Nibricoccus aquaticus]ATC63930.1 ATPase [Nibricoccus aquaticus]